MDFICNWIESNRIVVTSLFTNLFTSLWCDCLLLSCCWSRIYPYGGCCLSNKKSVPCDEWLVIINIYFNKYSFFSSSCSRNCTICNIGYGMVWYGMVWENKSIYYHIDLDPLSSIYTPQLIQLILFSLFFCSCTITHWCRLPLPLYCHQYWTA